MKAYLSGFMVSFLRFVNYLRSIINGWFMEWNIDFFISQKVMVIILFVVILAGYAFFAKARTVAATRIGFALWTVIVFGGIAFGMSYAGQLFK